MRKFLFCLAHAVVVVIVALATITFYNPSTDQHTLGSMPSTTGSPYVKKGVASASTQCEKRHKFCVAWPSAIQPTLTFVPSRENRDAHYYYQQIRDGVVYNLDVRNYWVHKVDRKYLIREVTAGCTSGLRTSRVQGGTWIHCKIEDDRKVDVRQLDGLLKRQGDRAFFAHTITGPYVIGQEMYDPRKFFLASLQPLS